VQEGEIKTDVIGPFYKTYPRWSEVGNGQRSPFVAQVGKWFRVMISPVSRRHVSRTVEPPNRRFAERSNIAEKAQ
jgi:hypothetical protein